MNDLTKQDALLIQDALWAQIELNRKGVGDKDSSHLFAVRDKITKLYKHLPDDDYEVAVRDVLAGVATDAISIDKAYEALTTLDKRYKCSN